MKFSFVLPALLATALAGPLTAHTKRDAAAVSAAIGTIETRLTTFNNTLNTFGASPSLLNALSVQTASNNVQTALTDATTAANSSAAFDDAGSAQVAQDILELQPQINSVLDNVVAKKPAFDSVQNGALNGLVSQSLQDQKSGAAAFGDAVTAKLTPTYAAQAPAINQAIQAKFDEAIAAYA
ncbi:hypothetical protein SLS56_009368 [Neofusicoccum ribis]|uniref:Uncharacterized protein n=1 Tax=Neofusicoccum ribis TaxID=45134 RepID=A0ABR3SHH6_9PEZI